MLNTSLLDLSYTYHYSKYSCSTVFYFVHLTFAYLVFLFGIFCFITRLHPKIKFMHVWCGRIYILSMLYATATSLLIHNTGLPLAILISFCYVLLGLTIGWILIKFHQIKMNKLAMRNLVNKLILNKSTKLNLEKEMKDQLNEISSKKTFKERLFSYKSFHALFMFLSWFNIAGRIFASDQSGDFTCYTYPVYKPLNSTYGPPNGLNLENKSLQLVPEIDPNYDRLPWANNELGWSMYLLFGPLLFFSIIGIIWSYCGSLKKC